MKTRLDVINRAFRRIGVKAEDEALTADQMADAGEVLDALFAEISTRATDIHGQGLGFSLLPIPDAQCVPDAVFLPLANALAVELAPNYGVQAPLSRASALMQVLSVEYPDDRAAADPVYF